MQFHDSNRAAWNQAAQAYRRASAKTVETLRRGDHSLEAVELPHLKNLKDWCTKAIHLQCAGGEDTLSLLNLGAHEVVGIDFSEEMIAIAQETGAQLGARATWVVSDVLSVPASLNGTADLVYTGRGAIYWLHDIKAWARTVARLLRSGGMLYLFEGHPLTYLFRVDATALQVDPEFPGYFAETAVASDGWTPEYIGALAEGEVPTKKYERVWPVTTVITALMAEGLVLETFLEHPDAYWAEFPKMPDKERVRIPNTYSLVMRKH